MILADTICVTPRIQASGTMFAPVTQLATQPASTVSCTQETAGCETDGGELDINPLMAHFCGFAFCLRFDGMVRFASHVFKMLFLLLRRCVVALSVFQPQGYSTFPMSWQAVGQAPPTTP